MNKALEQKLIGPMEESHTEEQSPQAVLWEVLWARRSKMAAKRGWTRVWAGYLCLWEEDEVCGCRNKWRRATMGPRGKGRAQGGRARPPPSWPGGCPTCCVLSAKYSQIFQKKNIFKFQGIWRTFIFRVFLYWTDKSDNRQENTIFILFNINNRK